MGAAPARAVALAAVLIVPFVVGVARAAAAEPVVFGEDFEYGQARLLTDYTGATGQTYAADAEWRGGCNGVLVTGDAPDAPAPGCRPSSWTALRGLAAELGSWSGQSNRVVGAYTERDPGPDRVVLETRRPIPVAPNRFVAFGIDVAAANCFADHAKLAFHLVQHDVAIPATTTPIDACAAPQRFERGVAVGTYLSDTPVLFGGTGLGVRLTNAQGSGVGNDFAFDNLRVFDVTPKLDVAYDGPAEVGRTATLAFTVTNTPERAPKNGWSFRGQLPVGLTATADPSTDCADATTGFDEGAVVAIASLAAGRASCTVTVPVRARRAGTYTTCAADTQLTGLDAPGCAAVRFTPPTLSFDAHAYGARLGGPALDARPVASADLTCTPTPGTDQNRRFGAGWPGVGSVGVLTAGVVGAVDAAGLRTSTAFARSAGVVLLGGLITADEIGAAAQARDDDTGAVSTADSVVLTGLRVLGRPVNPGTTTLTLDLPGVGTVVVNERVPLADGVRVTGLKVTLRSGVVLEVAQARAVLATPCTPYPAQ
ncbi:choice-of-anchor P family protein [Actinosynnema sp. NPDC020468]|uniref:choice-of-anchor P family protein n=1 Tax=Actinosynnema sp. NPDC020468 TaxID=3154488 RepID=UPI0034028ED1